MDTKMRMIAKLVCIGCFAASATLADSAGVLGSYQVPKDGNDGYGGLVRYQWDMAPEKEMRLFAQGGYLTGMGESDFDLGSSENGRMDVDIEVAPLEFGVLYDVAMAKQGVLYVGLGAGYYFIDNSMSLNSDSDSVAGDNVDDASLDFEDEFGAFALVGWEHDLAGNLSLFAEVRYSYLDADGDAEWYSESNEGKVVKDTKSDEYDLSGMGASLGLLWRW